MQGTTLRPYADDSKGAKVRGGIAVCQDEHQFARIKELMDYHLGLPTRRPLAITALAPDSAWATLGSIDTTELSGLDSVCPFLREFAVDYGVVSTAESEDFKIE